MSLKIYIAAPWKSKDQMASIATSVEALGHVITKKWWTVEDTKESDPQGPAILMQQAADDLEGVRNADLVLVINSTKSEGKAFEQGAAIALGKPILIVGKRVEFSQNVFHYLPSYYWVNTIEDALKMLERAKFLSENKMVKCIL